MAFLAVLQALRPGLAVGGLARADVSERTRTAAEKWHVYPRLSRCPWSSSLAVATLSLPRLCANLDLISDICRTVFRLCGGVALGGGYLASGTALVLDPDSGLVRPAGFDPSSTDPPTMGHAGISADGGEFAAISRVDPGLALGSPPRRVGASGGWDRRGGDGSVCGRGSNTACRRGGPGRFGMGRRYWACGVTRNADSSGIRRCGRAR